MTYSNNGKYIKYEHKALVQQQWRGKTLVLGEKSVPGSLNHHKTTRGIISSSDWMVFNTEFKLKHILNNRSQILLHEHVRAHTHTHCFTAHKHIFVISHNLKRHY